MNLTDIFTRVQRTFGDEAAIQVNKEDVARWCTDAQREIAIAAGLLETTAETVSAAATLAMPPNLLALTTVTANGNPLKQVPFSEAHFATDTGDSPVAYWVYAREINFLPAPTGDVTIKLYYTREPTTVSLSNETLDIPVAYHGRVLEYCMKQAYELDENFAASAMKTEEMANNLATQVNQEAWAQQQTYPTITILPEDY